MDELVLLDALIENIYDAVLDQSLWLGVLERAARFAGGPAATLFSKDIAHQSGQVFYEYRMSDAYRQSYFTKYIALDPAAHCQLFARVGDIISMKDFISYDELLELVSIGNGCVRSSLLMQQMQS